MSGSKTCSLQKLGFVEKSDDISHPIEHARDVPFAMQNGEVNYLVDVLHMPTIIKNLFSIGPMVE